MDMDVDTHALLMREAVGRTPGSLASQVQAGARREVSQV